MDDVLGSTSTLRHQDYVAAVTKIRRHYARGKSKSRVVMGEDAAAYMLSRGLARDIPDAEALGRRMAADHVWTHVSGAVEFLAAHRLYRFQQATVAETRLAIEAARVAAAAAAADADDAGHMIDGGVSDEDDDDGGGGDGGGGAPADSAGDESEGGTVRRSARRSSGCRVRSSGGGSLIIASASCLSVTNASRRVSGASTRGRSSWQQEVGATAVSPAAAAADDWDAPLCQLPTASSRSGAAARRCASLEHGRGGAAAAAALAAAPRRASVATAPRARSPSLEEDDKRGGEDGGGLSGGGGSVDRDSSHELLLHHSSSINSSRSPSRRASVGSTDGLAHAGGGGGATAASPNHPVASGVTLAAAAAAAAGGGLPTVEPPPFVRTPFASADGPALGRGGAVRPSRARRSMNALGTALTRSASRSGGPDRRTPSSASRSGLPAAGTPLPQTRRSPSRAPRGGEPPRDGRSEPYAYAGAAAAGRLMGVSSAPAFGPDGGAALWAPPAASAAAAPHLPAAADGTAGVDDGGLDAADVELAAYAAQTARGGRSRRLSLVRPLRRRSLADGAPAGAAADATASAAAAAAALAGRRRRTTVAPGAARAGAAGASGGGGGGGGGGERATPGKRSALARASRRLLGRLRPRAGEGPGGDRRAEAPRGSFGQAAGGAR